MADVTPHQQHQDLPGIDLRPLDEWLYEAIGRRILGEFHEMPGLALTVSQATRLFGIPRDLSMRILSRFVEEGLLRITTDGRYARGSARSMP
jgi:hypothetical protein